MTYRTLKVSYPIAGKEHTCDDCGLPIPKGTQYEYRVEKGPYGMEYHHYHMEAPVRCPCRGDVAPPWKADAEPIPYATQARLASYSRWLIAGLIFLATGFLFTRLFVMVTEKKEDMAKDQELEELRQEVDAPPKTILVLPVPPAPEPAPQAEPRAPEPLLYPVDPVPWTIVHLPSPPDPEPWISYLPLEKRVEVPVERPPVVRILPAPPVAPAPGNRAGERSFKRYGR